MMALKFNPDALNRARTLQQLGVVKLAEMANCAPFTISRLLTGHFTRSKAIAPLCKILNVKIEDCYVEED